jgi:hypothetical protein
VTALEDPRSKSDGSAPTEDEDWFGEGSSFESGEDLAAALFAMAGSEAPASGELPAVVTAPSVQGAADHEKEFELIEPEPVRPGSTGRVPVAIAPANSAAPQSWAVRKPGQILLPPRLPGRSGWSIRNSVQVLHRTEDVMTKLREQAVSTTFMSAAEVFRRSAPKRRRPAQGS